MTPLQRWGLLLYMSSLPWVLAFAIGGKDDFVLSVGILVVIGGALFWVDNSQVESVVRLTKKHRLGIILYGLAWILIAGYGARYSWLLMLPLVLLAAGAGSWFMRSEE